MTMAQINLLANGHAKFHAPADKKKQARPGTMADLKALTSLARG